MAYFGASNEGQGTQQTTGQAGLFLRPPGMDWQQYVQMLAQQPEDVYNATLAYHQQKSDYDVVMAAQQKRPAWQAQQTSAGLMRGDVLSLTPEDYAAIQQELENINQQIRQREQVERGNIANEYSRRGIMTSSLYGNALSGLSQGAMNAMAEARSSAQQNRLAAKMGQQQLGMQSYLGIAGLNEQTAARKQENEFNPLSFAQSFGPSGLKLWK